MKKILSVAFLLTVITMSIGFCVSAKTVDNRVTTHPYTSEIGETEEQIKNITSCSVSYSKAVVYTGKKTTLTVKVTNKGAILKEGINYTVKYSSAQKIGKHTITIKGIRKGGYEGSKTLYFNIVPNKPQKVKVTDYTSTSVTLSWNKVSEAQGYRIYLYDSSKKTYERVKTVDGLSGKLTKLSSGRSYKYVVRSFSKTGDVKYFSDFSAVITVSTAPKIVENVKSSIKGTTATVSWKMIKGDLKYKVYFYNYEKSTFKAVETVTDNKAVIKNIKKSESYYFSVRTYKKVGGKTYCSENSHIYSLRSGADVNKVGSEKSNDKSRSGLVYNANGNLSCYSKIGAGKYYYRYDDSGNRKYLRSTGRIIVEPKKAKYWNLIVVNSGREIPDGYIPKLECVVGTDIRLDYRVAPHYNDMYYAARRDGIILTPYSGYRSYERQKINFTNLTNQYIRQYGLSREAAEKKAAKTILPPGTSEHNLGLAMDICNTKDSFAYSKEYAWLMNNAYKYGFILRYTASKQSITGIVPEPWHWRYVGVDYAKKIRDSGKCLEEYLTWAGIKY